jgi:hypothetical protein
MCLTSARISAEVSVAPNAGMRGLRPMIAPPPAMVSNSESSGRVAIASGDEWTAGLTGSLAAAGPSPRPDAPWHDAHHLA